MRGVPDRLVRNSRWSRGFSFSVRTNPELDREPAGATAKSCMTVGQIRMSQAIQRPTSVRSRLHRTWTAGFITSNRQATMGMTLKLI